MTRTALQRAIRPGLRLACMAVLSRLRIGRLCNDPGEVIGRTIDGRKGQQRRCFIRMAGADVGPLELQSGAGPLGACIRREIAAGQVQDLPAVASHGTFGNAIYLAVLLAIFD